MGPPLKTSPKRIGHTHKYYVTACGVSVLLAERDEVQRVAEAHEAVDVPGSMRRRVPVLEGVRIQVTTLSRP
jgi:hypothetical protein